MGTATVYTAARMKSIEDNSIVSGAISGDNLILTKYNGQQVNAGNVRGSKGDFADPSSNPSGGINIAGQAYAVTGWEKMTAAATEDTQFPLSNGCSVVNTASVSGIQVPTAGKYLVYFSLSFNANTANPGRRSAGIIINSDTDPVSKGYYDLRRQDALNVATTILVSIPILLAANDIVQVARYTDVASGYGTCTAKIRVNRIG